MVGMLEMVVKAGAVFGLLALTVRLLRRIDGGNRSRRTRSLRAGGRRRPLRNGRVLEVVERTGVGRTATVVVVRVAGEHWVLGVTDTGINRLGDIDLDDDDPSHGNAADGNAHDANAHETPSDRALGIVDLRHLTAPAAQWAERVRSLRHRLPEREYTEDVALPSRQQEDPAVGDPAREADEVSA